MIKTQLSLRSGRNLSTNLSGDKILDPVFVFEIYVKACANLLNEEVIMRVNML